MENAINLHDFKDLKYVFDLKGSQWEREVTGKLKNSETLKDLNFLSCKRDFNKRQEFIGLN